MKPTFPTPEPTLVWNHFFDLVQVPRPSKAESAAIDFVERWAVGLGFDARRDRAGNLVVHVPATHSLKPTSAQPVVILQCHVDIVSVTAPGTHGADAATGKIPIVRGNLNPADDKKLLEDNAGDWINAPYTTLGADNGLGVAMMMAVAESKTRPVAMQLLFTVDEEAGMSGAFGLEPQTLGLTGKWLINIDTEDDDEITIGSAGGRDVEIQWSGKTEPIAGLQCYSLELKGLKGGHSGVEINQGRANANRTLSRTLAKLSEIVPIRLVRFHGGSRRNAIPDTANAVVAFDGSLLAKAQACVSSCCEQWNHLYAGRDNPIAIEVQPADTLKASSLLTADDTQAFLRLLNGIPTGICEMTAEMPTLVESSCNLAIVEMQSEGPAKVICSVRGTSAYAADDICDTLRAVVQLAKGDLTIAEGYPGWKPNLQSTLLKVAIDQYETLFGSKPKVHAVHAGLECGLLIEKLPGLDAISIGPTIKGNHAVGERAQISSVAKSFRYLNAILEKLA